MKKKFFITLIFTIVTFQLLSVGAYELDASIDDEIRKNYSPSAIENKLPALPKTSPTSSFQPPKVLPTSPTQKVQVGIKQMPSNFDKSTAIKIKKGTKFKVKSTSIVSDYLSEGARVSFVTLQPVSQKYITIPAGTTFSATVVDSHLPQITGNGGLVEIIADRISYNGNNYRANGKITKANHKKIFINNIKGERLYWKNVAKQIDKGENFYKKSRRASNKLADNPIGVIISPIPTVAGMGVYAVNLVGSPVISIFSKGGRISIPAGSEFEIKLLEDIYFY